MRTLKKIWAFIKKHYKGILAALGVILSVIALFTVRNSYVDSQIKRRRLDIAKRHKEIIALQGEKEMLSLMNAATSEELAALDKRIALTDQDIIKARAEVRKLTLAQKIKKFDELGY